MSRRASQQGWLPSSTQLFATVVVTTVLTIAVSLTVTPVRASKDTADATSTPLTADTGVIIAVGQLVQCRTPDVVSLDVLTATAKALKQGETANKARLSNATALISVGCTLQRSAGNWVAGPYTQHQQLQVSGVDTVDCLVRQAGKHTNQALHMFLLHPSGHSGQDVNQQAQLQAIEYAQLLQQSDSSAQDLLESLLRTSLPEECLAALQSYSHSNTDATSASMSAADATEVTRHGYSRQLLQTANNSTNSTGANSTTGAGEQPPSDKPAPEAPSNSTTAVKDAAKAEEQKGSAESGGKSNSTQNDSPQVIASDRVPTDANNSTAAGNSTALNVTLTPDAARLACALQPETGPCRAAFPRWAFEVATGTCKGFMYGGCAGNANNFVSQAACEAACLTVMRPAPVQQPTVVPNGPVSTTLDESRVLVGSAPTPAKSRAGGREIRSWVEQLLRVVLAGLVGVLTVFLL